jgi:hypothetical protein
MTNTLYRPIDTTEFVRVAVVARDTSGLIDPTSYPVDIAFVPHGEPTNSDLVTWRTATWQTVSGTYYAKVLVGPDGGVELPETDYIVLVRVNAPAEYPVREAGKLILY